MAVVQQDESRLPAVRSGTLDERLLFGSLEDLAPRWRWTAILLGALLTTLWSALLNGTLSVAWGLPDVGFYADMAQGRYDLVPAPFTSRPLAPLLMHVLARALHLSLHGGMAVLAFASVFWSAAVVLYLLTRSGGPRFLLLAVAAVPFWTQTLGNAGLPDPLYTALMAALLLAFALGRTWIAAGLILPLMLTRESTSLVLLCLLLVGWRQLRWTGALLGVLSLLVAAAIVRHVSAGGLPNPEHLSGGLYLIGKVLSNGTRSLGFMPWSNVYPELCGVPAWQVALHLGPVRQVGICEWNSGPMYQSTWALLITFGALPWLLVNRTALRAQWTQSLLFRFCVLYGGVSLLLAPALGTWYLRLFAYGWPLLLVAAPQMLASTWRGAHAHRSWQVLAGAWLVVQLVICTVFVGFPGLGRIGLELALQVLAGALFLRAQREAARGSGPPRMVDLG